MRGWGVLLALLIASGAGAQQAAPFDDADAQFRIKQASNTVTAASHEVAELTTALDTERQRVVQTSEQRELNQAMIADLERKLAAARTRLQASQQALKAAQDARAQGLASTTQDEASRRAAKEAEAAARAQREAAAARAQREAAERQAKDRPGAILSRMGLVGTWSPVCAAAGGIENPRHTYAAGSDGTATSALSFSSEPGYPGAIEVRQLSASRVNLRTRGGAEVIYEIDGRHMRVLFARRPDGSLLIQDGKYVTNGTVPPVLEKCSN